MTARPSLFLVSALCVALPAGRLLAAPAAPPAAAEDPAPAAKTPDEQLDVLAAALKERKTNDEEARDAADGKAVGAIDQLLLAFKDYDDAGKKKTVKAVSDVFSIRTKEGENRLYIAAGVALSEMGDAAQPEIERAMKQKHIEKRPEVRVALIESLAKHKNPKHVDLFLDLLKEDDNTIVVAAVNALSEYKDAEGKIRKEIVEGLVKTYSNVEALDTREKGKNPVWRDRLQAIEVPMNEALSKLTLQNFDTAPKWAAWFNDNRNKRW